MKRAFGIVCIISLIYLAALIIGFFKYSINEQDELQQLILSHVVDYCSDAAMQEVITGDDLEMDYSEDGHIVIDPKLALDTFVDMFCLNYDIVISDETRKHVLQNYIPVACMACYDGFYIAKYQPVKNNINIYYPMHPPYPTYPPGSGLSDSAWNVVFGPKLPYTYTKGATSFALNMGMEYADSTNGIDFKLKDTSILGILDKASGIAKINEILTNEIAYTVDSANESNSNWKHSFFIPTQLTSLTGASPITGPSLIVLVQNLDLTTARPISGFSVSGTRIGKARMVEAYIRNGIKYYCYVDKAPVGVAIDDLFTNVKDAALAGYYCDSAYMN